jgi:hypothetical protein
MMNIEYTAEQIESQSKACIAAYAAGLPEIVIQVDADMTPKGKRTARIVQTDRNGRQLRWYVAGRIYREFGVINNSNVTLTNEWLAA